jgi:ATP-binding cassette subfamily F protein 3
MSTIKSILSCHSVRKSYGNFVALRDASINIHEGEKIGLVGANGSGKSTLLKILAGLIEKDEGNIETKKNIRVGYIPQTFTAEKDARVIDFLSEETNKNKEALPSVLSLLKEFGLKEKILERQMKDLSGGEKTKIAVLRIILSPYDLFLLDEPTNNLDIKALLILEKFIKESPKAFIIVSHDRALLDKTVSQIIEIDSISKKSVTYDGNFSAYLKEHTAKIERQWKAYQDSVEKTGHMKEVIKDKMNRVEKMKKKKPQDNDKSARNAHIKNAEKKIQRNARLLKEKLLQMEMPEKPAHLLPLHVRFEVGERSGEKVFSLTDVKKSLPERDLGPVNLRISYGERILVLGENGSGKTTILKLLMGIWQPDGGVVEKGKGIKIGYLPQDEDILPTDTVMDVFRKHVSMEEGIARRLLYRFRIAAEDIGKKITELSSGEKSRLLLAIIMAAKPNCIILDEPTNHIDLEVLEELEEALHDFPGTLIVVSHDRYFIKKMRFSKIYVLDGVLKPIKNISDI